MLPLRVNAVARAVIQTTTHAARRRRRRRRRPQDTLPPVGYRSSPSADTLALFSIAPTAQRWHCAMSSPSYIQPKAVHASDHFKSNLQSLLHGGGKSPAPFIMPEFRPQSSSAQPAPYNAFQNMVSQSPMPRVSVPRQLSQLKPKQPFAVVCAASDAALQMNDEMAAVRLPLHAVI